ncbi:MAG: hypothetical protein M1820_010760 [Bogoriella megaspora]|nr:MAG: hypothetical protein M1820_010760 [Bogoriella megaspora]
MNNGAPGGPEGNVPAGTEYTLQGVMRFLQLEWHRYERERNAWDIERAEMKIKIAKQEGESRTAKKLNDQLNKQIRMLETTLKRERANKPAATEGQEAAEVEHQKDAKGKAPASPNESRGKAPKKRALSPVAISRSERYTFSTTLSFYTAPNKPHNSFLEVESADAENAQSEAEAEQLRDRSREYLRKCVSEINYLLAPPLHPPPPNLQHMADSAQLINHNEVPMSLEEVYLQQRHKNQQMQEQSLAQAAGLSNHQSGLPMMREPNNQINQQPSQMMRETNQIPPSQLEDLQLGERSDLGQVQAGLRFPLEGEEHVERVTHSYDSYGRPVPSRKDEPDQTRRTVSEEPDGWNFEETTSAIPEPPPDQPPPRRPDTDLFPSAASIPAKSPPRTGPGSHRRKSSESTRMARQRSNEARNDASSSNKSDTQNFKVRFGLRGHLDVVRSVIFTGGGSPSEPEICTAGDDGMIKRWIIPASNYGNMPGNNSSPQPPTSQHLGSTPSQDLDIQPYFTHRGHEGVVTSLAACPTLSSTSFSTGGRAPGDGWIFSGGQDRSIRVWERGRVDPKATLTGHADAVWTVCVLPATAGNIFGSGEASRYGGAERLLLASGSADGELKIWAVSAPPSHGGSPHHGSGGTGSRRGVGGSRRHSVTSGSQFPSSPQPSVASTTPFHYTLIHSITRLGNPSPTCISPLSTAGENFVVGFDDASILVFDTKTGEEVIGMASTETYDGTKATGVNAVVATSVGLEGVGGEIGGAGEEVGGATGRLGEGGVEGTVISGHEDRYVRFFDANSGTCLPFSFYSTNAGGI